MLPETLEARSLERDTDNPNGVTTMVPRGALVRMTACRAASQAREVRSAVAYVEILEALWANLSTTRSPRKLAPPTSPRVLTLRRVLNQDLRSGYIRIGHAASNCDDEFEYDVRVPLDDRSDEDSSRETDESEYHRCMPLAT
jgi:hypothetical protein